MLQRQVIARLQDGRAKFPTLRLLSLLGMAILLSGCRGLVGDPVDQNSNLQSINHIIFMAQENRGFDHYFGAMRQYWAANSIPDQSFDGLPQFNPASGAAPLQGPVPTNPGCDPRFPFPPNDCTIGGDGCVFFHGFDVRREPESLVERRPRRLEPQQSALCYGKFEWVRVDRGSRR